MKHGSLFSGIGGFDLAAEWMNWENVFHCEWNPFCQKVLQHYWPKATTYEDITKADFTVWRGQIDVLSGGFPCQPYSLAGKRLGKDDERHLWPEMLRAIREIQPRWVVGENVLGLVNWNGGVVFEDVQADLEAQGYEVQPFVLPASSVGAPHRRDRVWFVAYADSESKSAITNNAVQLLGRLGSFTSNSDYSGLEGVEVLGSAGSCRARGEEQPTRHVRTTWQDFPTVSPICHGDDGVSKRLDGITFSKWRTETVKAGGNAVVPQVVFQIFQTIQTYELTTIPGESSQLDS